MTDDYAKKRIIRDVTEVRTMKPAGKEKKRPTIVVKKTSKSRQEHYKRVAQDS